MTSNSATFEHTTEAISAQLMEVFGGVMRSSFSPLMKISSQYDLTFSQLKMLFILGSAEESLTVGELGEKTFLSLPAAGRAVEGLQKNALVIRKEDEWDRRVKRVTLTESGRNAINQISDQRLDSMKTLVSGLDDDQRRALAEALAPVVAYVPHCVFHETTPDITTETEASR